MKKESLQEQSPVESFFSIRVGTDEFAGKVKQIATGMELDMGDFNIRDFLLAFSGDALAGFVRMRKYSDCLELSTLGVLREYRKKGLGKKLVLALLDKFPGEKVFVTTVIPGFFLKCGFAKTENYPDSLTPKINFCHSFGFGEGEVHIMVQSTHGPG
jgi:N-acetylglutamate synthase-like GNAT family acetyltransferase